VQSYAFRVSSVVYITTFPNDKHVSKLIDLISYNFACGRGANYCDQPICMSVCLSVGLRLCVSPLVYLKDYMFRLHEIFRGQCNTLCTSGLWMMFSHNEPHSAWRCQYRRRRRAEASSQNFQRIRQGTPRCLTLPSYATAANCAPGAKFDVYDCLVVLSEVLCSRNGAHISRHWQLWSTSRFDSKTPGSCCIAASWR